MKIALVRFTNSECGTSDSQYPPAPPPCRANFASQGSPPRRREGSSPSTAQRITTPPMWHMNATKPANTLLVKCFPEITYEHRCMNTGAWYLTHAPAEAQPSLENQTADATRFCTQSTRNKETATETIVSNCFKTPPVTNRANTVPQAAKVPGT